MPRRSAATRLLAIGSEDAAKRAADRARHRWPISAEIFPVVVVHPWVEVGGFVLLGGKDIERRPESSGSDRIVRVRAFGLIGGVRVRVAG